MGCQSSTNATTKIVASLGVSPDVPVFSLHATSPQLGLAGKMQSWMASRITATIGLSRHEATCRRTPVQWRVARRYPDRVRVDADGCRGPLPEARQRRGRGDEQTNHYAQAKQCDDCRFRDEALSRVLPKVIRNTGSTGRCGCFSARGRTPFLRDKRSQGWHEA
jgi:hypothetical protein